FTLCATNHPLGARFSALQRNIPEFARIDKASCGEALISETRSQDPSAKIYCDAFFSSGCSCKWRTLSRYCQITRALGERLDLGTKPADTNEKICSFPFVGPFEPLQYAHRDGSPAVSRASASKGRAYAAFSSWGASSWSRSSGAAFS